MELKDRIHAFNTLVSTYGVSLPGLYKQNFEYAAEKTIYHIYRFNELIEKLKIRLSRDGSNLNAKGWASVDISIYFEFDAIVSCAKALFDPKLTADAKKELPNWAFKKNRSFLKSVREKFEEKIPPIRNDIIHQNENGITNPIHGTSGRTQVGAMAKFDLEHDSIEIFAPRLYKGEQLNIIKTISFVELLTSKHIEYFHDLIVNSYFHKDPRLIIVQHIGVNSNSYRLCLNDFELTNTSNPDSLTMESRASKMESQ